MNFLLAAKVVDAIHSVFLGYILVADAYVLVVRSKVNTRFSRIHLWLLLGQLISSGVSGCKCPLTILSYKLRQKAGVNEEYRSKMEKVTESHGIGISQTSAVLLTILVNGAVLTILFGVLRRSRRR